MVAANGVAGRQRSADQWQRHPAGLAVGAEPLLEVEHVNASAAPLPPGERPLWGVRVLDLTRVLAGPTTTGVLASWGAEVLRIDPPGFAEVPALVPVMTSGKRTTALDLAQSVDRQRFVELLATADVVVHGYRPGALHSVGLDPSSWQQVRPGLVDVCLDAYGWRGPWKDRRGFDSIVQHSVGITLEGQQTHGAQRPVPLPCQALDHGCGWLMAAAVAAGLAERCRSGNGTRCRTSLARFAKLVADLPRTGDIDRPPPRLDQLGPFTVQARTPWGDLRRLAWPGTIGPHTPDVGASVPIGSGAATWDQVA